MKEIFIVQPSTMKTSVLQYSDMDMFRIMLKRVRQWESEGKDVHILDVRDAIYTKGGNEA